MSDRDRQREAVRRLVKAAYSIVDLNEEMADDILAIAHEMGATTLHGSFPDKGVLASLKALLADHLLAAAS